MPFSHQRSLLTRTGIALAVLSLAACQSRPQQSADKVIANAHGGGSALATSGDSRLLASGGWGGEIRLWRLPGGAGAAGWRAHRGSVTGLAFLDDGQRLLSTGYDGRLAWWTLRGTLIAAVETHSAITAFTAMPGTRRFVTGHKDGTLRLWRRDGSIVATWPRLHAGRVRAVALDARRLASAGSDGRVFWWQDDATPNRLADPPSDARTLLFTPDGRHLLGAGWFNLFRWPLHDAGLQVLPTEHDGIINDLAYLVDGRLASISRQTDSAVLILDPATGATLRRLQPHDLCGTALSPSPDGRFLSTTSDDASVRIWHLDQPPPR